MFSFIGLIYNPWYLKFAKSFREQLITFALSEWALIYCFIHGNEWNLEELLPQYLCNFALLSSCKLWNATSVEPFYWRLLCVNFYWLNLVLAGKLTGAILTIDNSQFITDMYIVASGVFTSIQYLESWGCFRKWGCK